IGIHGYPIHPREGLKRLTQLNYLKLAHVLFMDRYSPLRQFFPQLRKIECELLCQLSNRNNILPLQLMADGGIKLTIARCFLSGAHDFDMYQRRMGMPVDNMRFQEIKVIWLRGGDGWLWHSQDFFFEQIRSLPKLEEIHLCPSYLYGDTAERPPLERHYTDDEQQRIKRAFSNKRVYVGRDQEIVLRPAPKPSNPFAVSALRR
ncbi:MAG TPA: hypothetical protein VN457_06120, partial [Chlamydiales bacterium]|nr:hypothetical protein [Chlamydiales bacterium]